MREIKFKVWHKRWKEFLDMPCAVGDGVVLEHHPKKYAEMQDVWQIGEDVEVVQYTGLKDKNGKEIYEGDILENRLGRICKIIWHEKTACWDAYPLNSKGEPDGFMTQRWETDTIIIGNIYENPELLK